LLYDGAFESQYKELGFRNMLTKHNTDVYKHMNMYDSKFDDYVNLNLPKCHCTIHDVADETYSEAHPHMDVVEHILL